MKYIAILSSLFAASALALETRLTSAGIDALLPTIVATTNTTRQIFSAQGATTYTDRGRDSFGPGLHAAINIAPSGRLLTAGPVTVCCETAIC